MSVKKGLVGLVLLMVVGALFIVPFGTLEAAKRPAPINAPECVPINFPIEGYWGMYCIDQDNDIVSATIDTNNSYTLNWDNTYAEFIVKLNDDKTDPYYTDPLITWSVCDSTRNCVGGAYP